MTHIKYVYHHLNNQLPIYPYIHILITSYFKPEVHEIAMCKTHLLINMCNIKVSMHARSTSNKHGVNN